VVFFRLVACGSGIAFSEKLGQSGYQLFFWDFDSSASDAFIYEVSGASGFEQVVNLSMSFY